MQVNAVAVNRCQHILSDLRAAGTPDFTMLSVAMREIRSLQAIDEFNESGAEKKSPGARREKPKGKPESKDRRRAKTRAGD